MGTLQTIAAKLRARRRLVVAAVAIGAAIVAALMFLVPSQLGFMLAGPLFFFPWCLLCIALARKPSDFAIAAGLSCAALGLAWPFICMI